MELSEGYYKKLIITLEQQVYAREDMAEVISLRKKVMELVFLFLKEKAHVKKLEDMATKEKQFVLMIRKKLDNSMQQTFMSKVMIVCIMMVVALWCFK